MPTALSSPPGSKCIPIITHKTSWHVPEYCLGLMLDFQAAAVVWKTELARSKTETLPSEVGSSTITYRQLWDTALDAATRLRDLLPKANEGGVHDHEAGTCRDDDGLGKALQMRKTGKAAAAAAAADRFALPLQ